MIDVRHITTGSPDQIGGIASVIRDSLAGTSDDSLKVSAHFIEHSFFAQEHLTPVDAFLRRVRSKLNRMCCIEPTLHPYRYPRLTFDRWASDEMAAADILHVHKPSLWRDAVRMCNRPDGPRLVVHAHSVDGFTGGCVLEQDCPQLAHGCRACPIVKPALQLLPPDGLRTRARQLRAGNSVIVANSRATLHAIERSGMIPDDLQRTIIYPAVSARDFYYDPPRGDGDPASDDEVQRIGFISYDVENPNKGFTDFREVVTQLRERQPVAPVVAGAYRARTAEANPQMHFLGPLRTAQELRRFYSALDVLIVPSESESFGKVAVEAQFCGTPVVCYSRGGLPETVLEGVTGISVPGGDTTGHLTEAVCSIRTWDISRRFGDRKATDFLDQFTGSSTADQYEDLYRQLHATAQ